VKIAAGVESADAGLDGRGNATIVWLTQHRAFASIAAVTRTANGRRTGPRRLERGPALSDPAISVDSGGDAIAVWSAGSGTASVIRYATRLRRLAWGRVRRLFTAGHGGANPTVGIDNNGHALVSWEGAFDAGAAVFREVDAAIVALYAHRNWGGRSGEPTQRRVLRAPAIGTDGLWNVPPQLSVDGHGDALIVWEAALDTGDPTGIYLVRSRAGLPFSPPTLLATGDPGDVPGSALGPNGAAAVSWGDELGSTPDLAAVAPNPRAGFTAANPISSGADYAATPVVAVDARGDVIAVWQDLGPVAQGSESPATPLVFSITPGG
jgi:hypothetical protein